MTVQAIEMGDVTVTVDGRVVTVSFARLPKRNALTQRMYETVSDTLEAADADDEVAAVIITGTGTAFTAGNDLNDFSSGANLDQVVRFLHTMTSVRVPLIAAVNGSAVGIGVTMLLHCDLVYVEPGAVLSVPFVDLGLAPEAASSLLLPRMIGERHATEMFLLGRQIDGVQAAEWGLANAAVTPVLDTARQAAVHLAAQPPRALRATKTLLRSAELSVRGRMAEEMAQVAAALGGTEFAEVMAARREKRPPTFRS